MWGSDILVSPVLDQGKTSVQAYIPDDVWYELDTGAPVTTVGDWVTLNASLDKINVHVHGGSILPLLPPTQRTDFSRKEKIHLLVAPDKSGNAKGELYWDDGELLDVVEKKMYTHISFQASQNELKNSLGLVGYQPAGGIVVGNITILGASSAPSSVMINNGNVQFSYSSVSKSFTVNNLSLEILSLFEMKWS